MGPCYITYQFYNFNYSKNIFTKIHAFLLLWDYRQNSLYPTYAIYNQIGRFYNNTMEGCSIVISMIEVRKLCNTYYVFLNKFKYKNTTLNLLSVSSAYLQLSISPIRVELLFTLLLAKYVEHYYKLLVDRTSITFCGALSPSTFFKASQTLGRRFFR